MATLTKDQLAERSKMNDLISQALAPLKDGLRFMGVDVMHSDAGCVFTVRAVEGPRGPDDLSNEDLESKLIHLLWHRIWDLQEEGLNFDAVERRDVDGEIHFDVRLVRDAKLGARS